MVLFLVQTLVVQDQAGRDQAADGQAAQAQAPLRLPATHFSQAMQGG